MASINRLKSLYTDRLTSLLAAHPGLSRLLVAYSGGRDSHVLLHRLASEPRISQHYRLQAVHINHGLQGAANDWAEHCARVCHTLGVEFGCLAVDARPRSGDSLEAAARTQRYQALAALLDTHSAVLTAHHQGDQAETVLLALLRGSGPRGLAAMPMSRALGRGWLLRPLLHCRSAELSQYARQHGLIWIEDPSNTDRRHARNLLRQQIVPQLQTHWPGLEPTLSRVAAHAAEASGVLDELAVADLAELQTADHSLALQPFQHLTPARQRNALRHWVHSCGLPPPSTQQLQQVLSELLPAAADRQPCVRWPGAELRRYRQQLYALTPQPLLTHEPTPWPDPCQPLRLPNGDRLRWVPQAGKGLRPSTLTALCVRYRQGGERFHPHGRRHSQSLKKLLQEAHIPPWERQRLPLLYCGKRLAAVPGIGVAHDLAASGKMIGWRLEWCHKYRVHSNSSDYF